MNKNTLIAVGAVALVALVVIFMRSSGTTSPSPEPSPAAASEVLPLNPPLPVPETSNTNMVKEFIIEAKNYSFIPATMSVKKGDTVHITLKNTGGLHDLRIDEFNVATKRIKSGGQDTIEFVADKTGAFEYYCSVGSHRAMGMRGVFTVTE